MDGDNADGSSHSRAASPVSSSYSNPLYDGPRKPVARNGSIPQMTAMINGAHALELKTPAEMDKPGPNEPMRVVAPDLNGKASHLVTRSSITAPDETIGMRQRRQKRERTYESLNYSRMMNRSYYNTFIHAGKEKIKQLEIYKYQLEGFKWVCCGLIGLGTASSAFFIDYCVDKLAHWKFGTIIKYYCVPGTAGCTDAFLPYIAMLGFNLFFVLIASTLVVTIAECALGSGIPEIKCFLNGIRHPGWLNAKTMMVKVFGVLFSVGATMPIGKEGPMIHSGAIWGAGLPQALFGGWLVGKDKSKLYFHNDRAKRDFVSAGAAAGVAAAFGSPIGGVLFSLEEGCSFWSQSLTWRVFFCSMSSLFMLNLLTSGILNADKPGGGWGKLASGGMIDFGRFQDEQTSFQEHVYLYDIVDIGFFILMGVGGGLFGGLWNWLQTKLTEYRMRRTGFTKIWKLGEALFFTFLNTTIMYVITYNGECKQRAHNETTYVEAYLGETALEDFACDSSLDNGQFNDLGSLTFNTLENAIRNMFHVQANFSEVNLLLFFIGMFITSCWTYGLYIPSGLFVPSLATGAAYGRFIGQAVKHIKPSANVGVYALVGAAGFLGGVVRMTISLTVILVEATDNVIFSFPIMITLLCAKWVGDHFNVGIYDIHIHLKKIPMLEEKAENIARRLLIEDVMTREVACLPAVVRVSSLIQVLEECSHNGFPVVEEYIDQDGHAKKRLLGVIIRYQLVVLLKHKVWGQQLRTGGTTQPLLPYKEFTKDYRWHRKDNIEDVYEKVPDFPTFGEQEDLFIDISLYMDKSPITLQPESTVMRLYSIFRGLGLRHLVVVDKEYCVAGIITRHELTEHKFEHAGEDIDLRQLDDYKRVEELEGGLSNGRAAIYEDNTDDVPLLPA
eukprot:m.106605 g.106605  ORF g.106605 m.106605 type:complete len:897 (-) comp10595_c0_seq2:30-2720(-)